VENINRGRVELDALSEQLVRVSANCCQMRWLLFLRCRRKYSVVVSLHFKKINLQLVAELQLITLKVELFQTLAQYVSVFV
jgi:hypothetical protein